MKVFSSHSARIATLCTGLLVLSAYLPLPLPIGLINRFLALRSPGLSLQAQSAYLRWGHGRISLGDLRLKLEQQDRIRADNIQAYLDFRPWSPHFGKPILLQIQEADGKLDLRLLEALSKLGSQNPSPFPLQIAVSDSSMQWTDSQGSLMQAADLQIHGFMSTEGAQCSIHGNALLPAQGGFSLYAKAGPELQDWEFAFESDVALVEDWPTLLHSDLPWGDGNLRLNLHATGHKLELSTAQIQASLNCSQLSYLPYNMNFENIEVQAEGDLRNGIAFSARGSEAHGSFRSQGALRFPNYEPDFSLQAESVDLVVDQELINWLHDILTEVGEIVKGLEPRGTPQAFFGAHWDAKKDFDWSLHVDARDTQITYRGFEDTEVNRVSFPYPATVEHGHLLTGRDVLVYQAEAKVSEQGRALSQGMFDFRPTNSVFSIDLDAEHIPLDERIPYALSGNPEIAHLWRQLGSPAAGTASLQIKLRFDGQDFGIVLRGEAEDLWATPNLLPVKIYGNSVWFEWKPGQAEFGGLLTALGGDIQMRGEVREHNGLKLPPDLRMSIDGHGASPSAAEMAKLTAYLHLPPAIASFPIKGDVHYNLQIILPLGDASPQLLASFDCNQSQLHWNDLNLDFSPLQGRGSIAAFGDQYVISFPRTWSNVAGGKLRASLILSSEEGLSAATVFGHNLHLNSDLLMRLQRFTGQEPWGQHIEWGGQTDVRASLNPSQPQDFQAKVDLNPLSLKVGEFDQGGAFRLQGTVRLFPEGLSAEDLRFAGPDVSLTLSNVHRTFSEQTLRLGAIVNSERGVSLESRLPLFVNADALAAIRRIGLQGNVHAQDLQVEATIPDTGIPNFRAHGGLIFSEVGIDGVSKLRQGQANVQLKKAWWQGEEDFGAELVLEQGIAKLGNVRLQDASARVHIDASLVRFTNLDVSLLGGKITTNGKNLEGQDVKGFLTLGLNKDAPVSLRCFAHNLQLEKMRREIGLGGSLAGKVHGYLNIKSPTPDPTFCRGEGRLHIENGVLGTVPILRSIWGFAGVRPPVFKEGDLEFRVNGKGRVYVDRMRLDHDLLEVAGEGFIDLDTNLNLKVTLRTFSVLGRLPLLKDLIDLLVEQQVYGPAEAPIIRQRAVGKLGGQFIRPPFPLWVPAPPKPNWRISPIIPVE